MYAIRLARRTKAARSHPRIFEAMPYSHEVKYELVFIIPFGHRTGETQALKDVIRSLPDFKVSGLFSASSICCIVKFAWKEDDGSSSGDSDEVGIVTQTFLICNFLSPGDANRTSPVVHGGDTNVSRVVIWNMYSIAS